MIQVIKIDGFRSLLDFSITLESGLNVLVGPNGSGKSNFVSFLDFMSVFIRSDLTDALGTGGGAGAIFSREKFGKGAAEMRFRVNGQIELINRSTIGGDHSTRPTFYEYGCTIRYEEQIPGIFVSHDELRVDFVGEPPITITRTTIASNGGLKALITMSPSDHNILAYFKAGRWIGGGKGNSAEEALSDGLMPEQSLLTSLAILSRFRPVVNELRELGSINVNPSIAMRPSLVSVNTTIGSDGAGLASALYYLGRRGQSSSNIKSKLIFPGRSRAVNLETVVSWCREINKDIVSIFSTLDFDQAIIRPEAILQAGSKSIRIPFSRLSDGTVKWIALSMILLTGPGMIILEEPENFLHPHMQETFILLCRAILENSNRSIVISTHSPTVLDGCEVGELHLFETFQGLTRVKKAKNTSEIRSHLETAQFGLGHLYAMGGVYA